MSSETIIAPTKATASIHPWQPVIGEELLSLLEGQKNLDQMEREMIRAQTVSVLNKCSAPSANSTSETGLALGYVQSGKTLSFTSVTALAADNGFPLIIVITGTSKPLFNQSSGRLRQDLRIDNPTNHTWTWQFFENPKFIQQHHYDRMKTVLDEWSQPDVRAKQTILIAVMKNHKHLENLIELLGKFDLSAIPALVIDDEADQAGLNTLVNKNDQSKTYKRLLELRDALPHHSFLQYTATPQAPLLINIIDVLSPRFIEVLEPGKKYVGLVDFFQKNPDLVRVIPDADIPSDLNPITGAPGSLQEAMQYFFIGVVIGFIQKSPGHRSMLVHPSRLQEKHADYYSWVSAVRQDWLRLLRDPNDPDRQELISELKKAHQDLAGKQPGIPAFDQIEPLLWPCLNRIYVWEVNARTGPTPEVGWKSAYAHILVGGQAMDRGFTVEGLTVTYMPRGKGVGNADTIQQRARFLGYKRDYLGLCRVYLESDVRRAYERYVEHEENVREQLRHVAKAGKPLTDWKRAFFLDSSLRPTRKCVLDLDYDQVNFSEEWVTPRAPHYSQTATAQNRQLVQRLQAQIKLAETEGHPSRSSLHRHGLAIVRLDELFHSFLLDFKVAHPEDSQEYTGLLLQIREFLDNHPNETAAIYFMSWSASAGQIVRERSLSEDGLIESSGAFLQGASMATKAFKQGEVYPGDRETKQNTGVTVQIHMLDLFEDRAREKAVSRNTPALAIWLAAGVGTDTLIQEPTRTK